MRYYKVPLLSGIETFVLEETDLGHNMINIFFKKCSVV